MMYGRWHAWQGYAKFMLSDEDTKILREFDTKNACVNWLYLQGEKEAARKLNEEKS